MKINKTIKILIGAEMAMAAAIFLLNPILAIFIVGSIEGGTLEMAGAAVAIFLIAKSAIRVPLAYFLDKTKGDIADYYSMVTGVFLFGASQFLYLFATTPWDIYAIQALSGLALSLAYTPWYGLFSKKLDRHHEDYDWSVENTLFGLTSAAASYMGGVIAQKHGFSPIFVTSGVIMMIGGFFLLASKNQLLKK